MKSFVRLFYLIVGSLVLCWGCQQKLNITEVSDFPVIVPDYRFVCIPPNIAPLNFMVSGCSKVQADYYLEDSLLWSCKSRTGSVKVSGRRWRKIVEACGGNKITVRISGCTEKGWIGYAPFTIEVSKDSIDPYIAYRLIEPGYELWNRMGIYQRNLTNFEEKAIIENQLTDKGCVNCHCFSGYSPETFIFHSRKTNSGTLLADGGGLKRLDFTSGPAGVSCVYPRWHPSGRYIAFSTNDTRQTFHAFNPKLVSVYDLKSGLVIYDTEENEIIQDMRFQTDSALMTFPEWSTDGKWLYFCQTKAVRLPFDYDQLKYEIVRVPFDLESGTLGGENEPVFCNPAGTAIFPRVSPDGRFLLFTRAKSGTFPVWHPEADLGMIDMKTLNPIDVQLLNSQDAESYHAWSSSGRWILFSSRRLDGQYTRLYIAHCDPDGVVSRPFVLPQKAPDYYIRFLCSYNIPEFISGPVTYTPYELAEAVKGEETVVGKRRADE